MIQKNRHTASRKRRFLLGLTTAASIMTALWCGSFVSLADATGTVKVASAKIREKTDTSSEVVGSTSQDKTVTIKSQVTDAAGVTWYEVVIDSGKTGYIRADLVNKNDDGEIPQSTLDNTAAQADSGQSDAAAADQGADDAVLSTGQGATGATVPAENAMDAQYATVSVNAKVRSAPSTNDTIVENLAAGAQVIVSGQSSGSSDGKMWYYVTFTGADGGEKSGFIRSDLLTLGDMLPVPEEVPQEEPVVPVEPEVVPVNNDYELVYSDAVWYLIDHTAGGEYADQYELSQLLAAAQNQSSETSEDAKTLVRQRIAIVALIALAVVLIIAVIIMAVKLRDAYYEDYEDDEEEEEEEEEEEIPSRRRRRAEEEQEEETPRRRRRVEEEQEEEAPRRRRRAEEEEETQPKRRRRMEEEETVKPAANTAAKRRAKNFLLDDDEFEFEFLNMDDKK
ncbi:MAG: SH3 domain-containing protein [Lachnospiraceae bacterium]|nr:SH3 domain-containing protein [Lachnospiraceae bacterium]